MFHNLIFLITVDVVIFVGGKFCENVSKTIHMGEFKQ